MRLLVRAVYKNGSFLGTVFYFLMDKGTDILPLTGGVAIMQCRVCTNQYLGRAKALQPANNEPNILDYAMLAYSP